MNWKTSPTQWSELVQVTDSYVVHARGFTVDGDIWLDHYAVNGGHKRWWNNKLEEIYGHSWDHENVLYWSVTGSGTFLMQFPRYENATDVQKQNLKKFLKTFGYPENEKFNWKMSGGRKRMKRGDL